ncbi:unnamed protein product [Tuber melanosporum]|uniref:(Perigord truffle) hypothetical protein n=1 Tax=Tuber melanosporum (strain Mel28) TaxID=656061 RepID=D5GHK8_TUBMM|nr:uncharacterized protein GSTUM_00007962001 [Tuber melanosporum]CAZ84001.1 unnamed protein product [Tuber melanosporum]
MATAQLLSSFISPPIPSSPSSSADQLPPFFALTYNYLCAALLLLPPLAYLTYKDYRSFLSLGPGGTPYNFYGYCTITSLRLLALRNPRVPGPVPEGLKHNGYLPKSGVAKRNASRPIVTGIAPHRQMNQRPRREIFNLLSSSLQNLADDYPRRLRIAKSCFEKHCPGLFSKKSVNKTCNGEIVHAHLSDGSMHMTLHPADAKMVIEAGWGERHPLARGGWCRRFVPVGFVMIYAPRTEEEVGLVLEIVKAGIGWVSGEPLDESEAGLYPKEMEANDDLSRCDSRRCHANGNSTTKDCESDVVQNVANAVMEDA